MAEVVDIEKASIKDLKALIARAGLSCADCTEKPELRERARQALQALGTSAVASSTAPAVAGRSSGGIERPEPSARSKPRSRPPLLASSQPWLPPPALETFRLGEFLWAGRAGFEPAPGCEFFPRRWYGALLLPGRSGACSLLLLGGSSGGTFKNDVWRLTVPRLGTRQSGQGRVAPQWTVVSPQDDGDVDSQGRRLMRKWRNRHDFGCCAASAHSGGLLIYVVGGAGPSSLAGDVWASEDGGASWTCTCRSPPWEPRRAPAICAVPGSPERLLMAGGMAMCAEVVGDAWLGDDAGATWTRLEPTPWSRTTGRYRAALLPLPRRAVDDIGETRMLLLGGCFIDGQDGEGACGGTIGLERLMHDAWECKLDLALPSQATSASWTVWGTDTDQRGSLMAKWGVEYATGTIDPARGTLIARLPERPFVSVGEAKPVPESIDVSAARITWYQAELPDIPAALKGVFRPTEPVSGGDKLTYVRLADPGSAGVPRLVLPSSSGVLLTGDGEWQRQLHWASLLGLRLEGLYGLPRDLWFGRVLPSLLPAMQLPGELPALRARLPAAARLGPQTRTGQLWEVVSGADKGGLIVRAGPEIGSAKLPERLAFGAVVRQEELQGERLRYSRIKGAGPATGWVSVCLSGKDLLRPTG